MTLQDFKKVKYNKKMKDIAKDLIALDKVGVINNLNNCYERASIFKRLAYKECKDFYYSLIKEKSYIYKYTAMQIISYNTFNFTVAFIIDNKLYYITKNNNLYCEIA